MFSWKLGRPTIFATKEDEVQSSDDFHQHYPGRDNHH